MTGDKHLLDILWERIGCTYLSDLKTPQIRPAAIEAIRETDRFAYPTEMWNETLSYIFGKSIILSSPRDVDAVISMRYFKD